MCLIFLNRVGFNAHVSFLFFCIVIGVPMTQFPEHIRIKKNKKKKKTEEKKKRKENLHKYMREQKK